MNGNPQTQDGFIRIATELFEALIRTRIPGEARQMLDAIIRKTYGFHKKQDSISTSQIMEMTGLSHRAIYKARRKLKEMNLITVSKKGDSYITKYCVNKSYATWKVSPKKETLSKKGDRVSPKKVTNCLPKGDTQKIKDTIQKIYEPTAPMAKDHQSKIIWQYASIKGLGKEEVSNSYGRYAKAAKELYEACGKDIDEALKVLDMAKGYFENPRRDKKLEWKLNTVAANVPEIKAGDSKWNGPILY